MIFFGLLNLLRGRGLLDRWAFIASAGLMSAFYADDWTFGAVTALGIAVWITPGWGKYFAAIHGRDDPAEHEIGWIDDIGYRLFRPDVSSRTNRRRGTVCMSLRGLYLYPLFLAYTFWNPWAPLIGLGCLLQGPIYWLAGRLVQEKHAVALAELLTGTLIGLLAATIP